MSGYFISLETWILKFCEEAKTYTQFKVNRLQITVVAKIYIYVQ